jgi:hypothetical protein
MVAGSAAITWAALAATRLAVLPAAEFTRAFEYSHTDVTTGGVSCMRVRLGTIGSRRLFGFAAPRFHNPEQQSSSLAIAKLDHRFHESCHKWGDSILVLGFLSVSHC